MPAGCRPAEQEKENRDADQRRQHTHWQLLRRKHTPREGVGDISA
jgi:hypothetical protein